MEDVDAAGVEAEDLYDALVAARYYVVYATWVITFLGLPMSRPYEIRLPSAGHGGAFSGSRRYAEVPLYTKA